MNSTSPVPPRQRWLPISISVVVLLAALAGGWMFRARLFPTVPAGSLATPTVTAAAPSYHIDEATRKRVTVFCGACHTLPAAEHFPRAAWHHEVERGFRFYTDSERTDLDPPPLQAVVAYYQAAAPEKLLLPPVAMSVNPAPVKFRVAEFPAVADTEAPYRSSMSAVNWIHRSPDKVGELFCSDMRNGNILQIELGKETLKSKLFTNVPHPTVVRVCDLDGNGQTELVVADLGSFLPEDHELGNVWWFPPTAEKPSGISILSGVGRVTDVQPVDVDGDGDQDLIVAEFGWHKTGGIHVLENQGFADGKPNFVKHVLDRRPGTIHVPVTDFNGDGRPDFVALISQEHESVVAFLNSGNLKFEPRLLDQAQDPAFGSSGLEMVDLDRDGDLDALITNGDSFDSYYIKPAHGVQWLENQGDLKFVRHNITPMPGVHRALAGDLDGDGDLDIVAVSFLPKELRAQQSDTDFDSLILLEQTQPGTFERYRLESGKCQHTSMELADLDNDGDLDLAVSNFSEQSEDRLPPLSVWWNLKVDTQP